MDNMDPISKLMFGLGILIGVYTLIYGLLIWRGFFTDRRPSGREADSNEPIE